MAAEKDYSFKVETRKLSKTDVPALARREKTKFEEGKKTSYSGKPVSEQVKALFEKHSAFRLAFSVYARSSPASNNSSSSSSSSKTATAAAEAGLAVSETAAAAKTRSWTV